VEPISGPPSYSQYTPKVCSAVAGGGTCHGGLLKETDYTAHDHQISKAIYENNSWVGMQQRNKKGTRRGDTQRPRAARLEAAIKRNNKQNIREERAYHGQHRASLAVTRLKFHGSFERKRQRRTGLQSCGCSPLSRLVGNFSADSELQTCGYKGYRGP
ncbi:hypothetical protein E3U43_007550, partial [Larimichthys crocea]